MKNRIVFMGSKPIGFHCLSYLINNSEKLEAEIVAVFSNENKSLGEAAISELARGIGLPVYKSQERLNDLDYDYLISVQYHEIIRGAYLSKAKKMAINLHMAPLPEYRGCNQFTFAILDGKKEFGTTLHIMSEGIDSGDIIAERRFPVPQDCFVKELYDLTFKESCILFEEEIANILNGEVKAVAQSKFLGVRGCSMHFRKEIHRVKEIDLSWSEEKIWRHLRATSMPGFPPPYFKINGKKVNLLIDDSTE